ncbi:MAG: hypothetical protein IKD04_00105 [Clostridia bacterium]|nr:hypothetical protein [Clostridia bacterium]
MSDMNCCRRADCIFLSVAASVIIGIVGAILTYIATISLSTVFLWVAFGIAVGFLAIAYLTSAAFREICSRGCVCRTLPVLIVGILGTVLTALVLLAVDFAATSIIGAIVSGALLGFFALVITAAACFAKCASGCGE